MTPADYDEVTLTAPVDPRLPGGGGYPVTFLDAQQRARALGATDTYYTTDSDYGDETHYWHGVDVTFNARMHNGLMFQGGTSTGRGVNDTCAVLDGPLRPADGAEHGDGTPAVPSSMGSRHAVPASRGRRRARARVVHDAEGRRAGERDLPLAAERAAGRLTSPPTARRARRNFLMTAAQFQAATGRPLRTGVTTRDGEHPAARVDLRRPGQ